MVPSQKGPHRIHADSQPLRYLLCGAALGVQGQYPAVIPLRIVKTLSSGRYTQAVAVGTAVQKVNHQCLF